MSEPNYDELAEKWIGRLEQEYWENDRCQCKEKMVELLKHVYKLGQENRK